MTYQAAQAVNAIMAGRLVEMSKDDYLSGGREEIQEQAARWIDENQTIYANIALNEVYRLDRTYGVIGIPGAFGTRN